MESDGGCTNDNNHSAEMSFRIRNDDRFFSRLMAKETSTPNSSSRIFYYGEISVAVPFTWEAQPGTPKHPLSHTSLPPLTPPPSFFSTSHPKNTRNSKDSRISSILARFPRSGKSKSRVSPPSSCSPTSSSSSSSSSSLAYYSSPTFSNVRDRDHGDQGNSPFTSSRSAIKSQCSSGFRGCFPFGIKL